ncbi:MAG: glycoside hydrolase, partial [Eubacterium sp.]|nr:glycoside hydrolase [Eubacterium sp.]
MKHDNVTKMFRQRLAWVLSFVMALTLLPAQPIFAADKMPSAGISSMTSGEPAVSQPFEAGMGGSASFGRPTLAVRQVIKDASGNKPTSDLTNDLIFVAAEARYGRTIASRGQDVIAAVSSDEGQTWKYSYPLQFTDSDGCSANSATINNPVLAEATTTSNSAVTGGTVYLLVNASPGTVNAADGLKCGTGFYTVGTDSSAVKRLALTANIANVTKNPSENPSDYPYYVGDLANGYAPILNKSDDSETNYAVDAYFNLYEKKNSEWTPMTQKKVNDENADVQQNIFYKDSAFHVFNANYTLCMTSTDGLVWSAPEILNAEIQTEKEFIYFSDGQGVTTTLNRIVIPLSARTDPADPNTTSAALITKDVDPIRTNNGNTVTKWQRSSKNISLQSPESSDEDDEAEPTWAGGGGAVAMDNGVVRMFLRTGRGRVYYADSSFQNSQPGTDEFDFTDVVETDILTTEDSRTSAVSYDNQINGKQAILATYPTGGEEHRGGVIAILQRQDDNTLLDIGEYAIDSETYTSACLGVFNYKSNVALIYQDGNDIHFENIQMWDILEENGNYVSAPLEYDLNLTPGGEAFTRTYHVYGEAAATPTAPQYNGKDLVEIGYSIGSQTTTTVPTLYSNSGSGSTLATKFQKDTTRDIANAEFTIIKESDLPDHAEHYSVYSEAAKRYLTVPDDNTNYFTRSRGSYVGLHKKSDGTFNVYRDKGDGSKRFLFLNKTNKNIESGNYNTAEAADEAAKPNHVSGFVLLKKRAESDPTQQSDPIPGYERVSDIVSGGTYLIGAEVTNDSKDTFGNTDN